MVSELLVHPLAEHESIKQLLIGGEAGRIRTGVSEFARPARSRHRRVRISGPADTGSLKGRALALAHACRTVRFVERLGQRGQRGLVNLEPVDQPVQPGPHLRHGPAVVCGPQIGQRRDRGLGARSSRVTGTWIPPAACRVKFPSSLHRPSVRLRESRDRVPGPGRRYQPPGEASPPAGEAVSTRCASSINPPGQQGGSAVRADDRSRLGGSNSAGHRKAPVQP